MITRLLSKQDEQDKIVKISRFFRRFHFAFCFKISVLRKVHSIICFVDSCGILSLLWFTLSSLLEGSLAFLDMVWIYYKLNFKPEIILLSIFMSGIQRTKLSWMQVCITKNRFRQKIFSIQHQSSWSPYSSVTRPRRRSVASEIYPLKTPPSQ